MLVFCSVHERVKLTVPMVAVEATQAERISSCAGIGSNGVGTVYVNNVALPGVLVSWFAYGCHELLWRLTGTFDGFVSPLSSVKFDSVAWPSPGESRSGNSRHSANHRRPGPASRRGREASES